MNGARWDWRESQLFLPTALHNATAWDGRGLAHAATQAKRQGANPARIEFETGAAALLRSYVDGWLVAGRDWEKWAGPSFHVWQAVNEALSRLALTLAADRAVSVMRDSSGKPRRADGPLAPVLMPVMAGATPAQLIQSFAASYFLGVLLDEGGQRVGKCERCGRYYFSKRLQGNKRWCGRSCQKNAGAVRATGLARAREHRRKLEIAQKALARIPKSRRGDWKRYVVEDAQRRGVKLTPNFLTRAVALGKIKAPEA